MDKKAIKNFAIEARKKLISEIQYKANLLGITAEGIADPIEIANGMEVYDIGGGTPYTIYDEAIGQRKDLVKQVKEKGFVNVVEEVAYTWFNRIIAIRFMEVNDYLPTRVRALSSEIEGKIEPDIITESPNVDLDFSDEEIDKIYQLKDQNKLDELFRLLFIKQCNKLNKILPELFEKTADYTEILLSISFINEDSVVRQLIDNISEDDFEDQVEIIGWLYQYYNTELKDDTFKQLKKRVKISKERIPAATQLFTPDWIVKYMVENSLGRLWLEGHPDSVLKENWKYYLDEAEQEPEVQIKLAKIREDSKNLKPEDIKVIDPCMGSGHILVYVFDVLVQIYTSVGYSEKDAAISILKNNIYGLDIDDRAYQLSYFAVMMKARSYNRRALTKNIEPQLCSIQESNSITNELIDFVANNDLEIKNDLKYLKEVFIDAKEYGSILDIKKVDFNKLEDFVRRLINTDYSNLLKIKYLNEIKLKIMPLMKQAYILSSKYDAVITNPPYMGGTGMNKQLSNYLKINFSDSKKDLFAVFIEKCFEFSKKNGFIAMITMESWMFLSSFEKLREKLISLKSIISLTHMPYLGKGNTCLGINFGTCAFIFSNQKYRLYKSTYNYIRYYEIDSERIPFEFPVINERYKFTTSENFLKIPGSPIAYWVSKKIFDVFEKGKTLGELIPVKKGMDTGNNAKYLRFWFEVNYLDTIMYSNNFKWVSYNKGGEFRRWYGNYEYVINWKNDGEELKNSKANLRSKHLYFKPSITWSALTSGNTSFRYCFGNTIFDSAGSSMFPDNDDDMMYYLALMNSKITQSLLLVINPTLNYGAGSVSKLPIIHNRENIDTIISLCKENINMTKNDWDSNEFSWNFKKHPFLEGSFVKISDSYANLHEKNSSYRNQLKYNEELINQIFIDIYDLLNEISFNVEDNEISIPQIDCNYMIITFISYAVGCMFGRYSLDKEGLIYAGGQWNFSKYSKFIPDEDNIIPILDTEYFEDDIVGRFIEFVKIAFGEETLEENLDFIASALKNRGNTSREIIRNYFLTDFYKDHLKAYKKHPIYWQFDSGKNNGFKALIYTHRYEPDLVARVRTDYLHKTQKALETAIVHNDRIIENSVSASEKSKALKSRDKLINQLDETRKYDEALAHVANQRLEIDLDDGVKVNHAKFQKIEINREGKKVTNLNLFKNI